jgi:hypothetical protein
MGFLFRVSFWIFRPGYRGCGSAMEGLPERAALLSVWPILVAEHRGGPVLAPAPKPWHTGAVPALSFPMSQP